MTRAAEFAVGMAVITAPVWVPLALGLVGFIGVLVVGAVCGLIVQRIPADCDDCEPLPVTRLEVC